MGKLKRIQAEFLIIRRTWVLWLHIVMPVAGIVVFLLYYRMSSWNDWGKISGYTQALAVVCPTLVGFVCAFSAEQELLAGHFQNFLGIGRYREVNLAVKLGVLMLLSLAAMLLAVCGFGVGYHLFVSRTQIPFGFYVKTALILWIVQIFEYCFHFFLGVRFSKGISIGAGIVESLLAALLMTGLGDGIWQWVPCAWAVRFTGYFMENVQAAGANAGAMWSEVLSVLLITLVSVVLTFIWFHFYEGKRLED